MKVWRFARGTYNLSGEIGQRHLQILTAGAIKVPPPLGV